MKKISGYELFARYMPAILTAIPFLCLGFLLMKGPTGDIIAFLMSLKFCGYLSISIAGLYFWAQLIRSTAKHFEKRYFMDKSGFPTSYLMLYSHVGYSDAYKDLYRKRIQKGFGFSLFSKDQEFQDPTEALRQLNDITKQVILRVGDGVLVGKHNQWYGFFRNLIGGAVYGVLGSVLNVILARYVLQEIGLLYISIPLVLIYCGLLLFRRELLIQHAEAYARQLHAEFMQE